MPTSFVEVDEVEIPGGRAFTVAASLEWQYVPPDDEETPRDVVVTITGLTELYEGDRDPREVPAEEAAALIEEHRALFEQEVRDEEQGRAEAAAEAREEDRYHQSFRR